MKNAFHFSGDRDADWEVIYCGWKECEQVMSGAVGPKWEMPPQHKVCLEFAERYPDSKEFVISHLSDPDPRIAAYAFKILIRIGDLQEADLPPHVIQREEEIEVLVHSHANRKTLREFFLGYFGSEDSESVAEADERSISWQDNELAEYLRATQSADGGEQDPTLKE